MKIANLLTPERMRSGAKVNSKKRSLELLSELVTGDAADPMTRTVFESLIGRERLGSTGLGRGVALPHARVSGIDEPVGAMVQLEAPIDFDAIDKQPVDLLFALVVPENSTDAHLRILANLAEMFRETEFCDRLRQSGSPESMYELLRQRQDGGGA
ncbi:MAG: PTS IIA-like nitrogen regulatory protein PtsN [Ectothiorhodospiraceae bacterium]|jgi:PTS system nitrogen regulatory IIA component